MNTIYLESKRGKLYTGSSRKKCDRCDAYYDTLFIFSKTNIGVAFLCANCKNEVLQPSDTGEKENLINNKNVLSGGLPSLGKRAKH